MKHFLIVVDMQKDFVDGALGTKEAVAIVQAVVTKIESFDGDIFATLDTHRDDYLQTSEGKHLPVPHCIKGTDGWKPDRAVAAALEKKGFTAEAHHRDLRRGKIHARGHWALHRYLRCQQRSAAKSGVPRSSHYS